jgi:hypothetical protein
MSDDLLRFPIGRFRAPDAITPVQRAEHVARLAQLPARLRASVDGLSDAQLDTPYREGGWSVRQVVQHIGDSHLNCLVRLALGLSEASPVIRPYDEDAWVRLGDAAAQPLDDQLAFVDVLHRRLVALARTVDDARGARLIVHPESGTFSVDVLLALCAWHADHHVAHITSLRTRNGW